MRRVDELTDIKQQRLAVGLVLAAMELASPNASPPPDGVPAGSPEKSW